MANCDICGTKIGLFDKAKTMDGLICLRCTRICASYASTNGDVIKGYWEENKKRYSQFEKTGELKNLMSEVINIDEKHRFFYIGDSRKIKLEPIIYSFDEIEGYSFVEVGGKTVTKKKGGIGRAIAGGVLFGGVGAIVGASTAKEETKKVGGINILNIDILMHSGRNKIAMHNYPIGFTAFLDKCIESEPTNNNINNSPTIADEILKFKGLLDQGVITEEEFNAKKKQLLNL